MRVWQNEDTKSALLSIEDLLRLKGNEHKCLEGNTDSRKEFCLKLEENWVYFFFLLVE